MLYLAPGVAQKLQNPQEDDDDVDVEHDGSQDVVIDAESVLARVLASDDQLGVIDQVDASEDQAEDRDSEVQPTTKS